MRKFAAIVAAALLLVAGWYGVWNSMLSADVARVKASIDHHYRAIKEKHPHVTLKADDVYATGFPFGFRIAVDRPTLTQIAGRESFAISIPRVELEKVSDAEGRYRLHAPATFDAMYATEGQAPELYSITVNEVPAMLLRAQADSRACSPLPGAQRCAPVAADAPLITFATQLPKSLVLDVSLNGKSQKIGFSFLPISIPVFMTIPADMNGPLQLFVGMLREAMVYGGQG